VHIAAVQTHGQRQVGPRQLIPRGLAAFGEHGLLRAELTLQARAGGERVQPHGRGVQLATEWQRLREQFGALGIRNQPGELALQVQQFGGVPLGQHRRQRAEGARRVRLARAVVPARAAQVQGAEQRAHHDRVRILVGPRSATAGASHLLSHLGAHLGIDHHRLYLLEQILGFGQLQPEGVDAQVATFDAGHLVHDRRLLVIFAIGHDDHLHAHPHAAALEIVCPNCAS
jgi:hypothetical protein